jgi:hypothetical protein
MRAPVVHPSVVAEYFCQLAKPGAYWYKFMPAGSAAHPCPWFAAAAGNNFLLVQLSAIVGASVGAGVGDGVGLHASSVQRRST